MATIELRPGVGLYPDGVDSIGRPYSIGSFGIEVRLGGTPLFLTAAHVVGSLSEVAHLNEVRVNYVAGFGGATSQDRCIGLLVRSHPDDAASREVTLDAALVEPADDIAFASVVRDVPTSCIARDVEETAHDDNPVLVHKRGWATGLTSGLLEPFPVSLEVAGRDSEGQSIVRDYVRGFFVEGDPGPFAKPGDSGAIVIDDDGCVVGMVVAVETDNPQHVQSTDRAFVVPVFDLLETLELELAGPNRPCTSV